MTSPLHASDNDAELDALLRSTFRSLPETRPSYDLAVAAVRRARILERAAACQRLTRYWHLATAAAAVLMFATLAWAFSALSDSTESTSSATATLVSASTGSSWLPLTLALVTLTAVLLAAYTVLSPSRYRLQL